MERPFTDKLYLAMQVAWSTEGVFQLHSPAVERANWPSNRRSSKQIRKESRNTALHHSNTIHKMVHFECFLLRRDDETGGVWIFDPLLFGHQRRWQAWGWILIVLTGNSKPRISKDWWLPIITALLSQHPSSLWRAMPANINQLLCESVATNILDARCPPRARAGLSSKLPSPHTS